MEFGTELKFINSRIGLDITYFEKIDNQLPVSVSLDGSTGYTATRSNDGKQSYKGWEVSLNLVPFRTDDFEWNFTTNFATLERRVESIAPGISTNVLASTWGGTSLQERVGEEWGAIYGRKYSRDENGNILLSSAGQPRYESSQYLGNVLPDFTGGMSHFFQYKNLSLSFDIDFQREIRQGNKIKIFYEKFNDEKQNFVKTGPINFAEIQLHNHSYELYRFENENEKLVGYFDSKGKSATKALMKTPINGARLSSGYGMRKHPILGYNKKHQGVDFAAPIGTPIMAAGTGHIEFVGNNGGAGKYIRIKHMNGYKTAYAHLSKYASGINKNTKVKQGQTIGYVGSTGLSTGPHLHYEVWFNGKRINPMTMKLPSGKKLENNDLKTFLNLKEKIDIEINEIS